MSNPNLVVVDELNEADSRGGLGRFTIRNAVVHEASVGERLGWQECEEPYCGSFDRQGSHAAGEYVAYECGDCVDGWTPPAELVEGMVDFLFGSYDIEPSDARVIAYRFLLEQARWIGEQ